MDIEFVRGDTFPFKFKLSYKDGNVIQKENIEAMVLTCRKYNEEVYPVLFQKSIDDFELKDEYYHACFNPEDTENLDYGIYNFDIEITLKNGYRKSLVSSFRITQEATIHKSEVE